MFPAFVPRVFLPEMQHPSRNRDPVAVHGLALAASRMWAVASSAARPATSATLLPVPISYALLRRASPSPNTLDQRFAESYIYKYLRQVDVAFVGSGERAEIVDASKPDR
jgi:hypothetical protein